jgi:hypothetical protein
MDCGLRLPEAFISFTEHHIIFYHKREADAVRNGRVSPAAFYAPRRFVID